MVMNVIDVDVELMYGRRLLPLCPPHKYSITHLQIKLTILNSTIHYDCQFQPITILKIFTITCSYYPLPNFYVVLRIYI